MNCDRLQGTLTFVRFLKVSGMIWLTAPKQKSPSEQIVHMLIP